MNGLLINLQFFSIIPIRKEIDMSERNLRGMVISLPLFGLILGLLHLIIVAMMFYVTPLSPFAMAVIFIGTSIILTGGIHVDGWMDTSDGLFSYRDPIRRLEIMQDPRIGAFGVLGVLFLLVFKFLFVSEIFQNITPPLFVVILFIPFVTRMFTGICLVLIKPAKKTGLGFLFHSSTNYQILRYYLAYIIPIIIILGIYNLIYMFICLGVLVFMIIGVVLFKRFVHTRFGGLTGDLSGAGMEGMELVLWLILWILYYYVMG